MLDDEMVTHQQELLATYRRNVRHLVAQAAIYGGESAAPLAVINSIHENRKHIQQIKAVLRDKGINISDHPYDYDLSTRDSTVADKALRRLSASNSIIVDLFRKQLQKRISVNNKRDIRIRFNLIWPFIIIVVIAIGIVFFVTRTTTKTRQEPVLAGTPIAKPTAAISPDNAINIVQIARWNTVDAYISVAFAPDGQTLVSGGNGFIQLWRASDGVLLQMMKGDWGEGWSLAYAPNSQIIASSSHDRMAIHLWRVSDGTLLRTLDVNSSRLAGVQSIVFSPDNQIIAAGYNDNTLKIWQVNNGALLRTLDNISSVNCVTFNSNGQTLATGLEDGTIKLWRASDGMLLRTLEKHVNSVRSIAFAPNGQVLASVSSGDTIKIWRVSDGALLRTLGKPLGDKNSVKFSPDGETLASSSANENVQLWRVSDGALLWEQEDMSQGSDDVDFAPDGRILVVTVPSTVILYGVKS